MTRRVSFFLFSAVLALVGCGTSNRANTDASAPLLTVSAVTYDFGPNLPGNALVKTVATIANHGTAAATIAPAVSGDAAFALSQGGGACGTVVEPGTVCSLIVSYTPATASVPDAAVLSVGAKGSGGGMLAVQLSGEAATLSAGEVTATANPYVAAYTLSAPAAGTWSVEFGPTASYGRVTSAAAIAAGSPATLLVAGMQANSVNHMRAVLTFSNGVQVSDADHVFTAGSPLPGIPANFLVTSPGTPQPGIELVDPVAGPVPSTAIATDLQGNVIWAYPFTDAVPSARLDPVKLLDNGHMLAMIAPLSYPPGVESALNELREFDLVGNTVRELSIGTLNAELSGAGFALNADVFTHDFTTLPNGHMLVMVTTDRTFSTLPQYPGQQLEVVADAVVDLDANWKPVWVWNEFDHFDINRQPYAFPDWTHSNSIAYSPDDGNFVVSLRHQNWVVKVNYKNGAGDGSLVWTMGEGGDFKLVNGVDPTDWFYAQHDAQFVKGPTAGVFRMTVMDNGDDRQFAPGVVCDSPGAPACFYTTIQEFEVDETAKTATLLFHQILPSSYEYSFFGGNVEALDDGNFEYALSAVPVGSLVREVTPGATPQVVWEMVMPGSNVYRAFRMPSLYPGVQWTR